MYQLTSAAHRICPRHQVVIVTPTPGELDLQLEPLAQTHRGFESRPAPLTVDELRAVWSVERARAEGAS